MLRKRPAKPLSSSLRFFAAPLVLSSLVAFEAPSVAFSQERAAADSWTNSTGDKAIKGEFVKLEGVNLTVRMSDGTEKVIPLSKLDDKSRIKAREMAKNGAKPSAAAPKSTTSAGTKSATPVVFPSSPSAQEFMDILVKELSNENPMVVWDALPASKQKQIQEILKSAATRIDPKTLTAIKKFRGELMTALKSKKQFILNSKQIPIPPDQKSLLEGSYDSLVALLEAYIPEEWLDASYLQQAEVRDLLSAYTDKLSAKGKDVENSLPTNSPFRAMLKQTPTSAKVENATAKDAMVTFVIPGQPEVPLKFVMSEGRWLPEQMVSGWDQGVGQITSALEVMNPKDIHKAVSGGLLVANGILGTVSTAESQEDFDDAVSQLMGMAQGMMRGAVPNQR